MAASVKEEISSATPARIEDLPFVQERLRLIANPLTGPIDQKHRIDRTTRVVELWQRLSAELRAARRETMSCLEATEGKGGAVVLKIVDRPRFDSLQDTISSHMEQIAALEEAIWKLDEIIENNSLSSWFDDLQHRLNSAANGIFVQKTNVSNMAAFYTQRNMRKPPEEALKDQEFLKRRAEAEGIIEKSRAYLEKMKPLVAEIEGVLESVGC